MGVLVVKVTTTWSEEIGVIVGSEKVESALERMSWWFLTCLMVRGRTETAVKIAKLKRRTEVIALVGVSQ